MTIVFHKYAAKVERKLTHKIALGYYVRASTASQLVSPLGAILKEDGDIRTIHDASRPLAMAMNDYATLHSVKHQTLQDACELAKPFFLRQK